MSLSERLLGLTRRFGAAAKFAVCTALHTFVPGAPAISHLAEQAFEAVTGTLDALSDEQLHAILKSTAQDVQRLDEVLALLEGDLGTLLGQLAALEGLPQAAQRILDAALLNDQHTVQALRRLDEMARSFDRVEEQNRQLLAGQDEMLPLMRRMAGLADFVEELKASGLNGKEFGELLRDMRQGQADLAEGRSAEAEVGLKRMAEARPQSGAAQVALAAAEIVQHRLPAAQEALTRAARLRPADAGLRDLQARVTKAQVQSTPADPKVKPAAALAVKEGDNLDGWLLEARLGAGGWGQVFKARKGDRVRALKVMHPELSADTGFVDRFKSEILTLGGLRGTKYLVAIEDFGFAGAQGCWYFVMEYIDGMTLEAYLAKKGSLTLGQAQYLFARVAQGLAAAHERGIVHRDIKPANILMRRGTGEPVLVDFGLALAPDGSRLTRTGEVSGYTAVFAAPEQLRGRPADARSDVYALGGSLCYALMYDQPEKREPIDFDPGSVPAEVRELLRMALASSPDQRPKSAFDFRERLKLAASDALVLESAERPSTVPVGRIVEEAIILEEIGDAPHQPKKSSKHATRPETTAGGRDSAGIRSARFKTRLLQLVDCQRAFDEAVKRPRRLWLSFVIGIPLALFGGSMLFAMSDDALRPAYVTSTKANESERAKYYRDVDRSAEMARTIGIFGGFAIFGGIIWLRLRGRSRAIRRVGATRDEKVAEILEEFPKEVDAWGGRKALDDLDLVRQMLVRV